MPRVLLILLAWQLPAADPAWIYVYSQTHTAVNSWTRIAFNGTPIAQIQRGTYFAIEAGPGRHQLEPAGGVPAVVHAGAYLRLDWKHAVGRRPIPVLTVVPAGQAQREIKLLSYLPKGRARSKLIPPQDPRPATEPELQKR